MIASPGNCSTHFSSPGREWSRMDDAALVFLTLNSWLNDLIVTHMNIVSTYMCVLVNILKAKQGNCPLIRSCCKCCLRWTPRGQEVPCRALSLGSTFDHFTDVFDRDDGSRWRQHRHERRLRQRPGSVCVLKGRPQTHPASSASVWQLIFNVVSGINDI